MGPGQRRVDEPLVWVTDGQVTDSHDHPDESLTADCAELVRVVAFVSFATFTKRGRLCGGTNRCPRAAFRDLAGWVEDSGIPLI